MAEKNTGENRILYFDLLRIVACFSVIMLHSAAQLWYYLPVTDFRWIVSNTYDGISRFGVPVFFMISGALFLNPERSLSVKRLYTHNILRLLCAYLVWAEIYGIGNLISGLSSGGILHGLLMCILDSKYHLWYIPVLIGIYMLLPVLRTWIAHAPRRQIEYFLILFLIFQIGKETLPALFRSEVLDMAVEIPVIEMAQSYIGYFVLGYYLSTADFRKRTVNLFYIAGAGALVCGAFLSDYFARHDGWLNTSVYDSFSIFTFIACVGIFLFFREKFGNIRLGERAGRIIREITSCTFGIYLSHLLVIELLNFVGFNSMSVNIIVGIPLLAVVTFIICLAIVYLIRRIPAVGRYVV